MEIEAQISIVEPISIEFRHELDWLFVHFRGAIMNELREHTEMKNAFDKLSKPHLTQDSLRPINLSEVCHSPLPLNLPRPISDVLHTAYP